VSRDDVRDRSLGAAIAGTGCMVLIGLCCAGVIAGLWGWLA
jgi:hypothetical protein